MLAQCDKIKIMYYIFCETLHMMSSAPTKSNMAIFRIKVTVKVTRTPPSVSSELEGFHMSNHSMQDIQLDRIEMQNSRTPRR